MPITTPRHSKRKHAEEDASGSGSRKKTKEERRAEKRAKHGAEQTSPTPKKEKTKLTRANGSTPSTSGAEFKLVRARTHVSLPPKFAADARRGVEEILDNLVMRYVPSLHGVLLSHRGHKFAQKVALMYAEGPYPTTEVEFDAGVWAPEIGMRITGRISLHATDHIGLLVHRTFNASISRLHIPGDGEFEYVHGAIANDPEINDDDRQGEEETGRWINSKTGETLGGESGLVEFTVIGYTIANQMLSLHGSLQPDPFSREYYSATQPAVQPTGATPTEDIDMSDNRVEEDSDDEVDPEAEDLAAPHGSKRKLLDVIPVLSDARTDTEPVKKKKKKGVTGGEDTPAVIEAAANVTAPAGKKKRKTKKAVGAELDGVDT